MKTKLQILGLVVLWLAMWGLGIAIHGACEGAPTTEHFNWVSIAGYDSEGLLNRFSNIRQIFSASFRHPLMNLELLPMFVFGSTLAERVGHEAAKIGIIGLFALIGSMCFLMQYLVLRRLEIGRGALVSALCLWGSFAHVWILGGLAESFGPSQLMLLGTALMAAYGVRDWRAWSAMAAVSGGMTLTNGLKPILAWLVLEGSVKKGDGPLTRAGRWRLLGLIAGVGVGLAVLGSLALIVKWAFLDGIGVMGGIRSVVGDIVECLPAADMSVGQRLWHTWHAFWCEPMMLHGSIVATDGPTAGYATYIPHLVGAVLLVLCVWSAVVNFARPIVKTILAMVSVDFILHVLIGWGVAEGQIYCGHWLWAVPLLVAQLPGRWPLVGAPLAVVIAVHNVITVIAG